MALFLAMASVVFLYFFLCGMVVGDGDQTYDLPHCSTYHVTQSSNLEALDFTGYYHAKEVENNVTYERDDGMTLAITLDVPNRFLAGTFRITFKNITSISLYSGTYNTTSKCFTVEQPDDTEMKICCTMNDDDAIAGSRSAFIAMGILTFFILCVPGVIHCSCAKTCCTWCTGKNPSMLRIYSLYMSMALWPWLIFVFVCAGLYGAGNASAGADVNNGLVVFVLCYIIVLIESFRSHEWQYMKRLRTPQEMAENVALLSDKWPVLGFWIKAWHYTTHTHTTVTRDASTGTVEQTHTHYRVKHVTYKGTQYIDYDRCEDASDDFKNIEFKPGVTKIKFKLNVREGDEYTSTNIRQQKQSMKSRAWDHKMDTKETENLKGMFKRGSVLVGDKAPLWMHGTCFWLATILCCTWPYRLFYRHFTRKYKYTFVKVVYVMPPMSDPATMQLSHHSSSSLLHYSNVPALNAQSIHYPYNMSQQPVAGVATITIHNAGSQQMALPTVHSMPAIMPNTLAPRSSEQFAVLDTNQKSDKKDKKKKEKVKTTPTQQSPKQSDYFCNHPQLAVLGTARKSDKSDEEREEVKKKMKDDKERSNTTNSTEDTTIYGQADRILSHQMQFGRGQSNSHEDRTVYGPGRDSNSSCDEPQFLRNPIYDNTRAIFDS